mmetsp:Transcript_47811/g.138226  ORF Transcript_47811/g.138226 Transcript_47811/m.138226 type:complete len:235 (+) Transcript_47811:772-1476(+)
MPEVRQAFASGPRRVRRFVLHPLDAVRGEGEPLELGHRVQGAPLDELHHLVRVQDELLEGPEAAEVLLGRHRGDAVRGEVQPLQARQRGQLAQHVPVELVEGEVQGPEVPQGGRRDRDRADGVAREAQAAELGDAGQLLEHLLVAQLVVAHVHAVEVRKKREVLVRDVDDLQRGEVDADHVVRRAGPAGRQHEEAIEQPPLHVVLAPIGGRLRSHAFSVWGACARLGPDEGGGP